MNPYTLWNIYIMMRTIHGIYITYSFFAWLIGTSSATLIWMFSFIYTVEDPYAIKQLEDKKTTNNTLDKVD